MSFSETVKKELCGQIVSSRHCRCAELAAYMVFKGNIANDGNADADTDFVIAKFEKMRKMLDIDIDSNESEKTLKLVSYGNKKSISPILVQKNCCKQAFIRGAFIASGSVTDPEKGYHFEIVCDIKEQADLIISLIKDFGLEPRYIQRKKYHVVYMKDASMIVDILNVMGAHVSLMNMENVRILKDMRNSVNRRVNCETANINKTVCAAMKQMDDIRYIEKEKGLGYLPDSLRVVAEIRMLEPEMPLKEIGNNLNPPLGKSGVNHRLRKISEIADELRRN